MLPSNQQTKQPPRSWYRLHRSTWLVFVALTVVLTLLIVPGEVVGPVVFDYLYPSTAYEHGWPMVYLERLSYIKPTSFEGPAWMVADGWSLLSGDGYHRFSAWRLAINVLVATALLAIAILVFERWRRRRRRIWNFSLKELFVGSLCVAVILAWYAYHRRAANHRDAFHTWNDVQGEVVGVEEEFIGPLWMGRLVGRERLGIFWRIVSVDAYVHWDERDDLLQAFARLDELSTVQSVCFSQYDASIETLLRDSPLFQRIAHIELMSREAYYEADDAIDSLLNLRQLRRLTVYDDSFSPGDLDRLRRGLPNCTVEVFGVME